MKNHVQEVINAARAIVDDPKAPAAEKSMAALIKMVFQNYEEWRKRSLAEYGKNITVQGAINTFSFMLLDTLAAQGGAGRAELFATNIARISEAVEQRLLRTGAEVISARILQYAQKGNQRSN